LGTQLAFITDTGSEPQPRTRELAMSAAWHGGLTRSLVTTDGQPVDIVFRGNWSHGFGPDFANAMITIGNATIQTGDIEIHLRASDWVSHGHHLDTRYNTVILHVVSRADTAETRRADGLIVPTVVLDIPDADLFVVDQELPDIWSTLGHSVCAEDLALREPGRLRAAILRLGDQRFSERVSRYEGELTIEPLSLVLLRGMFEAFGYSQNREPMRELAGRVIESGALARIIGSAPGTRLETAGALLFGIAGFLPLSPVDAHFTGFDGEHIGRLERRWAGMAPDFAVWNMPSTMWTRARTRPANHPAARLSNLATLLGVTGGDPTLVLLDRLRTGGDIPATLRDLARSECSAGLGEARAIAIAASVVLPVAMAYAHHIDDHELEDAVSRAWVALPRSEWSRPAKRALGQAVGDAQLGVLGERAIQGLLHLDRTLCTPRRCFECPVAAEVIRDRQRQRAAGPAIVQSILPT
jgi:hypothetical protein